MKGGSNSVVSASEIKSEDPGFDPLVGKGGGGSIYVPPSQPLCRLVFCTGPPFVCMARNQTCAHIKDPVPICRKRVGLTAGGMVTEKYCIHTLG